MKRKIDTLRPYTFSSEFTCEPAETGTGDLCIRMSDLSALVTQTQITTASLVRDETLSKEAEKFEQASAHLKTAFAALIRLADQLERAALTPQDRTEALQTVRHIAQSLVDGQTDLFDQSRSQLRKNFDSR